MPGSISRFLIKGIDLLQGRQVWSAYRRLDESQWWSPSRLQEYQNEALRRRLQDLAGRSSWLQQALEENDVVPERFPGLEGLTRLPVLDRQALQEQADAVAAGGLAVGEILPNSTGGSTGTNVTFGVDRGCWRQRDAIDLRLWSFLGLQPGARAVSIWGAPMDLKSATRVKERVRRLVDNKRMFSAYRIGVGRVDEILDWLARVRPEALFGYASVLDNLAGRAAERGGMMGPRVIVSSAEALFPDQRRRMEQAWGAEVFNLYGCREVGLVALECTAHQGMHLMDERLVVEVGEPGAPAADILVTDLDNRATPFVRYRIGDLATAGDREPCPCGRGLRRIGAITGRSFDVVRGPEGQAVGGTFWSLLLRTGVQGVSSFQVIQHELDQLEIRVTPLGALTAAGRDTVVAAVRSALGEQMQVRFREFEKLDPLPSGKHRFVVSALTARGKAESAGGSHGDEA